MVKPTAQVPTAIINSGKVGMYRVTVWKGLGVKPPIIKAKPFSIHIEAITAKQAKTNAVSLRLNGGITSNTTAIKAKIIDNHINPTYSECPS